MAIIHFSGHGGNNGDLIFEDEIGEANPISLDGIEAIFEECSDQVISVVLNACYSEKLAKVIGKHVDFVIGMSNQIDDRAAIAFSVGFYQALANGRPTEKAFKFGVAQMKLRGVPDTLVPVLIKR